jgi:hypothetical protein
MAVSIGHYSHSIQMLTKIQITFLTFAAAAALVGT